MRHLLPDLPRLWGSLLACCLVLLLPGACEQPSPPPEPPPTTSPPPVPSDLEAYDNRLVEAIQSSVQALDEDSSDPEGWLRLGKIYEAHQLHDYAAQAYERAVALADDDPKAWYRLAITRSKRGELPPTIEAFEAVHKLAPDYGPAWRRRGHFLLEMGHPQEAGFAFAQALERSPKDASARLGTIAITLDAGDAEGALTQLDSMDELAAGDQPLWHRLRGRALARLGRDSEAEAELAKGRGARPGGPDPWSRELNQYKVSESTLILRSDRLLARGQPAEALAVLRPLEAQGTDDVRVWRRLGSIYTQLEQHASAARSLERACGLRPNRAQDWLAASVAQRAAGEVEQAEASCRRALELEPELSPAALLCADLLLAAGRAQEVVELAASSKIEGPYQAEFLTSTGKAFVELGSLDEALLRFEKALTLQPKLPDALAGSALVHVRMERVQPASNALLALKKSAPDHPMYRPIENSLVELIVRSSKNQEPR